MSPSPEGAQAATNLGRAELPTPFQGFGWGWEPSFLGLKPQALCLRPCGAVLIGLRKAIRMRTRQILLLPSDSPPSAAFWMDSRVPRTNVIFSAVLAER